MHTEANRSIRSFAAIQAAAWFAAVPDSETLYSCLARLHPASGFHRAESASQFWLGHANGAALTGAPAGLSRLEEVTGGVMKASEKTLRARTVLGPYLALMPQVRRSALVEKCLGSDPRSATIGAGLALNRVASSQPLRLCRDCLLEQRSALGHGFWRVQHQWPGCWVCEKHQSLLQHVPDARVTPKQWLTVEESVRSGILKKIEVPNDIAQSLKRIGSCVQWLAGRRSVQPDVLQVIARERLVALGQLRHEALSSRQEYEAVHHALTAPLAAAGIPDFVGFRDGRWVRQVLIDRRNLHPLRWAVLLASEGPVDSASLDAAYLDAAARVPHPSLFEESQPRRSCAPARIYQAFDTPGTLSELSRLGDVKRRELLVWLRKDPELGLYRRKMNEKARREESRQEIESYQAEHPDAFRSQVIRDCLRAVRWLEANDPELLDVLLLPVQPKYTRQRRLDWGP